MVNTPSPPVLAPLGGDDRRLRAFRRYVLWHSKMEMAAALHHTSRQRTSTTTAATQTVNYVFVSAAATYAAPASVHVIEYVTPAPVMENIAPVPAVISDVACQRYWIALY